MLPDYLTAFVVPLVLIAGIVIPRKLVRGKGKWRRSDFYLGLEFCWSTLGLVVLEFYLLSNEPNQTGESLGATQANTTTLIITVLALFLVMTFHQNWEASIKKRRQALMLGLASNAIGLMVFMVFIFWVKGVAS